MTDPMKRKRCWYRCDKVCATPRDCAIAGWCCECWNPAEIEACRRGAMWVWAEDIRALAA